MKVQSYSSNEVGVEFKVWAPTFNRVTHRLYLLGSLNELGAWNIEDALQALPATDLHIWSVQASVPAMSRFEWVWLKTNALTKKVEWERPVKRFRTVSCFSAVLHTVWAEHDEVFLQSAANVELTTFKTVDDGYILALTGSSHTLGAWDLQRALTASEFPKKSGYWKVSFSFDARTNLDFKWAVVKGKDLGSVLVKEQIPHQLYGRQTWMRVAAPWMTTSTVIVDILPLNHTLDNLMGRTDIIVRERKRRLVEIRTWLVSSRDSGGFDMSNLQPPRKTVSKSPSQLRSSRSVPVSPTPSVKFQRDQAIEESIKKRTESLSQTERLTNQLSKDFRASPQVFAIKGVGQTEMPTDVINVGCLRRCGLVPDGELRVLDKPARPPVSMWSLSLGLATLSASGQRTQAAASSNVEPSQVEHFATFSADLGSSQAIEHDMLGGLVGQCQEEPANQLSASPLDVNIGASLEGASLKAGLVHSKGNRLDAHTNDKKVKAEESALLYCSIGSRHRGNPLSLGLGLGVLTSIEQSMPLPKCRPTTDQRRNPEKETAFGEHSANDCVHDFVDYEANCGKDETITGKFETLPKQESHRADKQAQGLGSFGGVFGEINDETNQLHAEQAPVDDSEFFKRLESLHSESLAKLEQTGDTQGDSGLVSFGVDAITSRSGNESTANDPEVVSIAEDHANEFSRKEDFVDSEEALCQYHMVVDMSLRNTEVENPSMSSSASDNQVDDEGFSESEVVTSDPMKAWTCLCEGPLTFDLHDNDAWWGAQPAYWEVLHQRRVPVASFVGSYPASDYTLADLDVNSGAQANEQPSERAPTYLNHEARSGLPLCSTKRAPTQFNIESKSVIPPCSSGGSFPPLQRPTGGSPGGVQQQLEDNSGWRCLTQNNQELCSEWNACKLNKQPSERLNMEDVTRYAARATHRTLSGLDVQLLKESKSSSDASNQKYNLAVLQPPGARLSNEPFEPCAKNKGNTHELFVRERGDIDTEACQRLEYAETRKKSKRERNSLHDDSASLVHRREIAQALEVHWGRTASGANDCPNPLLPFTHDIGSEHVTPVDVGPSIGRENKDTVKSGWGNRSRLRRTYNTVHYSPTDFNGIVHKGTCVVDRRAMARRAEKLWGQMASGGAK